MIHENSPEQKATEETGAESSGGVRALERGLDLLACFDVNHPSWRMIDLSRAVGLHKATAHRLIKTLEQKSFLVADPASGEYRLGSALLPVSYLARSYDQLVRIAHPHLERLAASTRETVGLSVWTDRGIVQIDHIPTVHFFKPAMLLGNVSADYGTTHSKIFLAYGPEERLSKISFGGRGQDLTLSELARVQKELETVAAEGIAWDMEERAKGVFAVGVPIRDSSAEVIASIAVVVPADRFGPTERESIASAAKEAGSAISRELGFLG